MIMFNILSLTLMSLPVGASLSSFLQLSLHVLDFIPHALYLALFSKTFYLYAITPSINPYFLPPFLPPGTLQLVQSQSLLTVCMCTA